MSLEQIFWDFFFYVGVILVVFVQISPSIQERRKKPWEWTLKKEWRRRKGKVDKEDKCCGAVVTAKSEENRWMVNPGVFAIMWTIIYGLFVASIIVLLKVTMYNSNGNSDGIYLSVLVLLLLHLFLNKLWTVAVGDYKRDGLGMIIIVLLDITLAAITVLLLIANVNEDSENYWALIVCLMLSVIPGMWLVFATFSNYDYLKREVPIAYSLDEETQLKSQIRGTNVYTVQGLGF